MNTLEAYFAEIVVLSAAIWGLALIIIELAT